MPNYQALKTALTTTYNGQTDAQIIAAVNAVNVPQAVDIPISAVTQALALNGLLPTVKGWATNPPPVSATVPQAAVTAAQTLGMMIGPPPLFDSLQMSVPATAASINSMVTAIVTAGLLPQALADGIIALGSQNVSQASLWGFTNGVSENDLVAARAMP